MNQAQEKVILHGPYDATLDVTVFIKYLYKSGGDGDLIVTLHCKSCSSNHSIGTRWQDIHYDAIPYKLSVRLNGVFFGPVMASNLLRTRTACGIHVVSVMLHVKVGGQSLVVTQMTNDTQVFTSIFRYKHILVEFDIIRVNFLVGWEIQEGLALDLSSVM